MIHIKAVAPPKIQEGRYSCTVFIPVLNSYTDSQKEVFIELAKKCFIQNGHVFVLPIPCGDDSVFNRVEQEFGKFFYVTPMR